MSRFSSVQLDLSRFPPPLAIRDVDHAVFMAERLERLEFHLAELGVPFNVSSLASDPAVAQQRGDAWRELRAVSSINDAVRAGLIAFAVGADLEHLAAFYGLSRRVIVPATESSPAAMEGDDELRRRTLLAPEAFATAGTEGGYEFHALTADTRVLNANVWSPGPGEVAVALQAREGVGAAPADVVGAVRAQLHRRDIKPLTDVVSVRSVTTHDYAISVRVYVRPGPDPVAVHTLVQDGLAAMAAARRLPARDVPLSAIIAAAMTGPVDRVVVMEPPADIVRENGELAVCTGISVEVLDHDG